MDLNDWLVFFHILGAIVWVGGVIVMTAAMERANRSADRAAVLRVTSDVGWVGTRLMSPAGGVVIGVGIWLVVREDWASFSQVWIWLSLVLVAVSAVVGMSSGPQEKGIARLAEGPGPEDSEIPRRFSRVLWLARLNTLILLAVLGLMVFKPGAPSG